jgi:4-amino-4-deoxy-L-arabinose transferase-like glycosyltransferase
MSLSHWTVPLFGAITAAGLVLGSTLWGQLWGYGYFIDELYYVACASRLAFGYVDHPPLAPAILRLEVALLGDSLAAIRVPSAVAFAATVLVTAWITMRLGGARFAQLLAATSLLSAPLIVVLFSFYSMNALELLLWTASLATVFLLAERGEPRLWLVFGALSGIALENKHTFGALALAVVVGLALTAERRLLASRYLVLGGALAFSLFLPNLLWQVENGFPSLEFYRNATLFKNRELTPLHIAWNQILFMNPVTLPVWASGLYFCVRERPSLRFVPWTYLVLLGMLVVSQSSRPDRMAGIYPFLIAAGAVQLERALGSLRARALALATLAAGFAALAPITLPVLPPEAAARYVGFLGIDTQVERGAGKRAELPQWLADRFGWEELVRDVGAVVDSLPPEERSRATLLAPSYGHAGALELFGRGELPPVISPHNNYHVWGRSLVSRLAKGPAVSLEFDADDLAPVYGSVERVKTHQCGFCMTWRNDMGIFVARKPKLGEAGLRDVWESAKHFE